MAAVNGYVEEMYSGHNVVTSYNAIESTKEEFAKLNNRLYDSIWKSQFISGIMIADYDVYWELLAMPW